jgi:protein-S-isoprenylcysteine O-methyltransferase Ste14
MGEGKENMDIFELWLGRSGGLAGLAMLALAVWHMLRSVGRPAGRQTGPGARFLRAPILVLATLLFAAAMLWLWRPLPLALPSPVRLACLALGAALYFASLGLYLWGLRALGAMFTPSSGFGVRLQVGHWLITTGPYALIRHPMYLAVITAGIGGLLLYRTWAMLLFAVAMFGLIVRAHREEETLSAEFGAAWKAYCQRVPAWLPHTLRGGEG